MIVAGLSTGAVAFVDCEQNDKRKPDELAVTGKSPPGWYSG